MRQNSSLTSEKAQILPLLAILIGVAAIVMLGLSQLGNKAVKIAEADFNITAAEVTEES